MQALGSFVGVIDEFFDITAAGRFENISGSLLQGIGNSMQAMGGIEEMRKNPLSFCSNHRLGQLDTSNRLCSFTTWTNSGGKKGERAWYL